MSRKYIIFFSFIILVLIILAGVFYTRLSNENRLLLSAIEDYKQHIASLESERKELEEKQAVLLNQIKDLDSQLNQTSTSLAQALKKIKELQSNVPTTPPGCEEVVAHYQLQVKAITEAFTLCQKETGLWKERSFTLENLYNNEHTYRLHLEAQLEEATSIILQAEILANKQKVSIKRMKMFGAGAVILASIIVVLSVIR